MLNFKQRSFGKAHRVGLIRRLAVYCRSAGIVLALVLTLPIPCTPFLLPVAHAHHGGGGASGGGGPSGGGGGGETMRKPPDGYGKGGRGVQGMKS